MSWDFLSKLSDLIPFGYYDKSKDMVTVHFFSKEGNKSDVIAYLKRDMSWDLREVVSEKAVLLWDRETIEILHKPLEVYKQGSQFDKVIRDLLLKIELENSSDDSTPLREKNKMFRVLENNKYDD